MANEIKTEVSVSLENAGSGGTSTEKVVFTKNHPGTVHISDKITVASKVNASVKTSPFGKVMKWFVRKNVNRVVKFSTHDGVVKTINVSDGTTLDQTLIPSVDPYRDSNYLYTFSGWNQNPSVSIITANTTFTAQYTKVALIAITWRVDGQPNYTTKVAPGEIPVYDKGVPVKAATSANVFVFQSWDKDIVPASAATTYNALFTAYSKSSYASVIYKDGDGNTFASFACAVGSMPTTPDGSPTKTSTVDKEYKFIGWDPIIHAVTAGDNVYTAQFSESTRNYTVSWKNYNGITIRTDKVAYGAVPTYLGAEPEHPDEGEGRYVFNFDGWDPVVAAISGDTSFTAKFVKIDTFILVRWLNYDNSVIASKYVAKGSSVSYSGAVPTRPKTVDKEYTFDKWTPAYGPITANTDYKAQYTESARKYTVTFKNADGTILKTMSVAYGSATPNWDGGYNPSLGVGYRFTGWHKSSNTVNSDVVVTAQYVNVYKYEFKNKGVVVSSNYYAAGETVAIPEMSGYAIDGGSFKQWSPSVPTLAVAENKTFDAMWTFTAKFISEGKTVKIVEVDEGAVPVPPSVTHSDGFTFQKWSPLVDKMYKDTSFVAIWQGETEGQVVNTVWRARTYENGNKSGGTNQLVYGTYKVTFINDALSSIVVKANTGTAQSGFINDVYTGREIHYVDEPTTNSIAIPVVKPASYFDVSKLPFGYVLSNAPDGTLVLSTNTAVNVDVTLEALSA